MTSSSGGSRSRSIAVTSVDYLAWIGWAIAFVVFAAALSPAFEQQLEGAMYVLMNL